MVLESVVADLLNRFLGDYVENLDKSQLKLGIWGGKREGAAGGCGRGRGAHAAGSAPVQPGPCSLRCRDPASGEGARAGPPPRRQVRGAGRPVPACTSPRCRDRPGVGDAAGGARAARIPAARALALSPPACLGGLPSQPSAWPLWLHSIKKQK